jgi:hypothetical protein
MCSGLGARSLFGDALKTILGWAPQQQKHNFLTGVYSSNIFQTSFAYPPHPQSPHKHKNQISRKHGKMELQICTRHDSNIKLCRISVTDGCCHVHMHLSRLVFVIMPFTCLPHFLELLYRFWAPFAKWYNNYFDMQMRSFWCYKQDKHVLLEWTNLWHITGEGGTPLWMG